MPDQSIEDRLTELECQGSRHEWYFNVLFDSRHREQLLSDRLGRLEDYTVAELEDAKEWMLKTAVGAHKSMLAVRKEIHKRGDTQAQDNNYNRLV